MRAAAAYRSQMLLDKRWQPIMVLLLGVLILLSLTGGILLAAIAARLTRAHLAPNSAALLTLVITVLGFHGAALIWVHQFLKLHEVTWGEAFGFARKNYGECALIAALTLPVALGGMVLLGNLSDRVLRSLYEYWHWKWLKPGVQSAVQLLQQDWQIHLLIVQGFVAIILAPVAEEVLFRGVIYTAIKQRGHHQLALWSTAFLFALIHFYPVGFLSLILLAVLLVAVYERTKNLLAAILLHSAFNAVNFALIVAHPKWAEDLFKT